jgi:hypothetical protein
MGEGLSTAEVGKEIAEHRARSAPHAPAAGRHDRLLSITEAVMLSLVAVLAAWSGYCAAKWGTEASLDLNHGSALRTKANRADLEALQLRTLDSVSFNAVLTAYATHDAAAQRVTERRLRPGYRPAFRAWLATHPLKNANAPPGPAFMPQYRIPQEAQARALDREADAATAEGHDAGLTSDKYVRITVLLATVLFLVGISGHFSLRGGRYALVGIASVLLIASVVSLLSFKGPP